MLTKSSISGSISGSINGSVNGGSAADEVDQAVTRLVRRYLQLKESLQADSPNRSAAVMELQSMASPRVVRRFASRLLKPDPEKQNHRESLALIDALEEYGVPAAATVLTATRKGHLGAVKFEDRYVQNLSRAIRAHPERWEWLLPITNSEEAWARRWAISNGQYLMEYQPGVIDHWFKMVMDLERPTNDRRNALVALRGAPQLSRSQLESLIPLLVTAETGLQGDALITLASHYQSSRTLLAARLAEDDPELRDLACFTAR